MHDQTSVTGVQGRDGFVDYMKQNEPNIKIVDIQYSGDPGYAGYQHYTVMHTGGRSNDDIRFARITWKVDLVSPHIVMTITYSYSALTCRWT